LADWWEEGKGSPGCSGQQHGDDGIARQVDHWRWPRPSFFYGCFRHFQLLISRWYGELLFGFFG